MSLRLAISLAAFAPALLATASYAGTSRDAPKPRQVPAAQAPAPAPAPAPPAKAPKQEKPAPVPAPAPAPVEDALPPPPAEAVELAHDFVERSGLASSFDDWLRALQSQFLERRKKLDPAPPEHFFLDVASSFDLAARRRSLDEAVARTLPIADLRATVDWLRLPVISSLPQNKQRVSDQVEAAMRMWHKQVPQLVQARRAGTLSKTPYAPLPQRPLPPGAADARAQLLEKLGYGQPDAFRKGLIDSAKNALPEEPASTWTSPDAQRLLDEVTHAVERSVDSNWTPDEARALLAAMASPAASLHQQCIERLKPTMADETHEFTRAFNAHFDERYASYKLQLQYVRP